MTSSLRWKYFWLVVWLFGMGMGMYLSIMPTTPREVVIPHLDKLIHGSSYALLAIFAGCIFEQKSARWKALFWLVLYGGLIELAQGYLPTGRTMEFADFIANSTGVIVGAYLASRWNMLLFIEHKLQFSRPRR
jgi:VanZ family protein